MGKSRGRQHRKKMGREYRVTLDISGSYFFPLLFFSHSCFLRMLYFSKRRIQRNTAQVYNFKSYVPGELFLLP